MKKKEQNKEDAEERDEMKWCRTNSVGSRDTVGKSRQEYWKKEEEE
jgi:hypothetical protein